MNRWALVVVMVVVMAGMAMGDVASSVPVIELDKAVHFTALNGSDVIVGPGTYGVEAIPEGLKLKPKEGSEKDAILIQARSTPHQDKTATPHATLKLAGEDEVRLSLFSPEREGMEAVSSLSGVHTRATGLVLPPGGCCNTVLGENALPFQDNRLNTAIGYFALKSNSSGNHNTATGGLALTANTIGFSNVAVGYQSLFQNLNGNDNTAIGTVALGSNNSGIENVEIGSQALLKNKGGNYNTAVGAKSLMENVSGNFNTATGIEALKAKTTGEWNTAIGTQSLFTNSVGRDNTAIGTQSLFRNSTGSQNTATGVQALHFNTVGSQNTAVGNAALLNNTIGTSNTAIGYGALENNVNAINNTAVGARALRENKGSQNTAIGISALERNVAASMNTAIGVSVLAVNEGEANTGVGHHALARNQAGARNAALGSGALFANFKGNNNTAIGHGAGANQTTGSNNTSIGFGAGANQTTDNDNIYINNSGIQSPIESGTIRIGTAGPHTRVFLAGVTGVPMTGSVVVVNAQGQLGIQGSSLRYKEHIQDMGEVSEGLQKLRPVSFRYKSGEGEPANPRAFGLIAEEVAKVYPELVTYSATGEVESVQYLQLTALLLNELQQQEKTIQEQQTYMRAQDKRFDKVLARIAALEAK